MDLWDEAMPKQAAPESPVEVEPHFGALSEDIIAHVMSLLPQAQRAACALVCRRWADVYRRHAPLLSATVDFTLLLPDAATAAAGLEDRCECFTAWVAPRAAAVQRLSLVVALRRPEPAAPAPNAAAAAAAAVAAAAAAAAGAHWGPQGHQAQHVVWGNLVSVLTLMGPTLRHLTLEWPEDLHLSQWCGSLTALESASFTAPLIVVRPGLGSLPNLLDLRFRSTRHPLQLGAPTAASAAARWGGSAAALAPPVLPPHLLKLRLEGCHLTEVPPALSRLTALEDLVLSDNDLRQEEEDDPAWGLGEGEDGGGDGFRDAAGFRVLSRLTTLQQLTMMSCNMTSLPSALSALTNLRVLYLDMSIQLPPPGSGWQQQLQQQPMHRQCDRVLAPLRRLAILSMGACCLQAFPAELAAHTSLRAVYFDDNGIRSLPAGAYLDRLRVLGIDWRVLFNSHTLLAHARRLDKLCLMSIGKLEAEAAGGGLGEDEVAAVVTSIVRHPSLTQVLLPALDGHRSPLFIAALNVLVGVSRAHHLVVHAVTYQGIANEWLDWLRGVVDPEEEAEEAAAAAEAGSKRVWVDGAISGAMRF